MSQGTVMIQTQSRLHEKDFTIATPEEFVHRFGGTKVINKVSKICRKACCVMLDKQILLNKI